MFIKSACARSNWSKLPSTTHGKVLRRGGREAEGVERRGVGNGEGVSVTDGPALVCQLVNQIWSTAV